MAKLRIVKDGVEIRSVDLAKIGKPELVVGRDEGCDIKLPDRSVGREHAVLRVQNGAIAIQKKTQFGRVAVNGVDTSDGAARPGDVISIADYQIQYISDGTAALAAEPVQAPMPVIEAAPSAISLVPQEVVAPAEEVSAVLPPLGDAPAEAPGEAPALSLAPLETTAPPEEAVPQEAAAGSGEFSLSLETPPGAQPEAAASQSISLNLGSQAVDLGGAPAEGGEERTSVIPAAQLDVKICFKPGDANVEEFLLKKSEIVIGRGADCDIILQDKTASRKHLILRKAGAQYVAEDLGSGNGTFVNGEKFTRHELSGGDVLRIGDTEFTFSAVHADYMQKQHEFAPVSADDPVVEAAPSNFDPGFNAQPQPAQPYGAASFGTQATPAGGIPGMAGAGTIPGLGNGKPKKESLLEKFKKQPPKRKLLIGGVAILGMFMMMQDDPKPKKPKAGTEAAKGANASFDKLPKEKKQFVLNTYQLAFDLFKNQEFERSLFEIAKVHEILPEGYKDSKDMQRIAKNQIEREREKQDEKHRKEEQERIAKEVAELVKDAEKYVGEGKETEARETFTRIFELDPENATALRLKQQMDEKIAQKKRQEEEQHDRDDKKNKLVALISEGRSLYKKGKYHEVIARMQDAPTIGLNDQKLLGQALKLAKDAAAAIKSHAQPFIDAGRAAYIAGDFAKARDSLYKALKIDPDSKDAAKGLAKIREVLHDRSKVIYTDAVVAESIGDFENAKIRFRECIDQAMPDDIYYGRCTRKLKRFAAVDALSQQGPAPASAKAADEKPRAEGAPAGDPEMPALPTPPMEDK